MKRVIFLIVGVLSLLFSLFNLLAFLINFQSVHANWGNVWLYLFAFLVLKVGTFGVIDVWANLIVGMLFLLLTIYFFYKFSKSKILAFPITK
ncbi:MAG: hypothetical protein KGJ93_04560 [Patescibacteria group bacterium]|nr:hypothetical protein [Patescibacteria group bacterium]